MTDTYRIDVHCTSREMYDGVDRYAARVYRRGPFAWRECDNSPTNAFPTMEEARAAGQAVRAADERDRGHGV